MISRKVVILDIETIPDPDCIPLLKPIPLPDLTVIKPDGRVTDPVKIAASVEKKQAEAMAKHEQEKSDQIRDMWKNVKQNIPICIGWDDGKDSGSFFLPSSDTSLKAQGAMLTEFWSFLAAKGYDHFVTFNGISFDIPCLELRSMKARVRPTVRIDCGMYRITNHTDCRMVLGKWDRFAQGSLDYYMRYFDLSTGKDGLDGSMMQEFYRMGPRGEKIIRQYCEKDCADTWLLYELIRDYWRY